MPTRVFPVLLVPIVIVGLSVLSVACAGGSPSAPSSTPTATSALASRLEAELARSGLPALAAVVVHAEGVPAVEAVGVRRLGAPERVQAGSLFHLGSNTKAMTAALAARLVEQGRLGWESRLVDALPELAPVALPAYRETTVEQLLAHRSGLPALTATEEFDGAPAPSGTPSDQRAAFAAWLLTQPPAAEAGGFLYSNAGYALAGHLVERLLGTSWENALGEQLGQPLGFRPVFGWPVLADPSQPWGHFEEAGRLVPHDLARVDYRLPAVLAPAGDVALPLAEYGRFLQMHLQGLRGVDSLLRAETVKRLHRPVGAPTGVGSEYGLGWAVLTVDGLATSAHDGSAGTFYVIAFVQPERNVAVAVATNAGGTRAGDVCVRQTRELLREYAKP